MISKLYSITEAAKKLGISRNTLSRLIASGDIGYIKINKRKKIPQSSLEEFINQKTIRYDSTISGQDVERRLAKKSAKGLNEYILKLKREV